MYQIEAWAALRRIRRNGRVFQRLSVDRNVWALGLTSLFTDVGSEMVGTVLPIYLVLHLGLTPFNYGIVDGLYHGVTALLRLVSGIAVDRSHRCKELALVGYGVSAVSRLGLLAAGASWPLITVVVALDRAAKGVRTVPRDVLISLSSRPENLATSFGVHRALDSAGAMLGPLVALGILGVLPEAFDVVFVASFCVSVCGLGVITLFVRNAAPMVQVMDDAPRSSPDLRTVLECPGLLRATIAASMLSAVTVSDGFLYLVLQREVGFSAGLFPLLYVGTAACYLMLAVPAGRVADLVGRRTAFLGGYLCLGLSYGVVMQPGLGVTGLCGCLLLLGAHYALTDGVLMALVTGLLPTARRGTGLAVVTTATSVTRLFSSVLFGALWTQFGLRTGLAVFLTGLLFVVVVTRFVVGSDAVRGVDVKVEDGSGEDERDRS
jgi:hypothetical protein